MKTIEAECDNFLEMVVPDTAPKVQIDGMRKAFYAGAVAMHNLFLSAVNSREDDEVSLENIERLSDEIHTIISKEFKRIEDDNNKLPRSPKS